MSEQPKGEFRFREAQLVDVSFPKRLIELIVTPYEQETLVPHQGRMVTEVFSRGAYDGIEKRPNRIRVNRDHDVKRTVGKVLTFHDSAEGLVAEIKISNMQELGDETLDLAADDCLDASAGYLPMPGGELWENRNRVRIRKAWLGHIALVPEPAYEGARVLSVRNAQPGAAATPLLDEVRGWKLADAYGSLFTE